MYIMYKYRSCERIDNSETTTPDNIVVENSKRSSGKKYNLHRTLKVFRNAF